MAHTGKTGDTHKNRAARAQSNRESDKAGVDARKELAKQPRIKPKGKLGSQFGARNALLCQARVAHRNGDSTKATKLMAEAAVFAPLTGREKLNVEHAR